VATATSETEIHVFEPYKYALPKLAPYFRDLWGRRQFATYMARSNLKGQHFDSFFGQFWLVLNPLLLSLVYFLLTSVLAGSGGGLKHFVGLLTGLFAFFYTRNVIQFAAASITGGGKMIVNMSLPKMLLPLSTTFTAILMYLPTLMVYAVCYIVVHHSVTWNILWLIPIFVIQTVFSLGIGLLFAAVTLYFRDMATLLPYLIRIWMYVSPVLFSMAYIKERVLHPTGAGLPHWILGFYQYDPLTPIINPWNTVLVGDGAAPFQAGASYAPQYGELLAGLIVAVVAFVIGAWYFMSREREFAVRL
jgi:ABC-type polysaccharide/polyol phosphate export permease